MAHSVRYRIGSKATLELVMGDITDETAIQRIVETVQSRLGPISILVNCAGGDIGARGTKPSPNGATAVAYAYAYGDDRAERARGVTPEYIGAMRAAIPRLVELDVSDFTQLRAIGVTPEYARDLAAAGFPSISAHDLVEARAVGVTGSYIKSMRAAGMRGDLDDFVQLRAVGVDPAFAERVRAAGIKVADADDLVELRVLGTAHGGTHESRIRVKIKRDERSRDDGGNPDANPDPDDDPDG